MKYLKVNGHLANETKGTLFFTDGTAVSIDRKDFNTIMETLMKDKKMQVSEDTTLTY
mgnify:CR=1 FL=1